MKFSAIAIGGPADGRMLESDTPHVDVPMGGGVMGYSLMQIGQSSSILADDPDDRILRFWSCLTFIEAVRQVFDRYGQSPARYVAAKDELTEVVAVLRSTGHADATVPVHRAVDNAIDRERDRHSITLDKIAKAAGIARRDGAPMGNDAFADQLAHTIASLPHPYAVYKLAISAPSPARPEDWSTDEVNIGTLAERLTKAEIAISSLFKGISSLNSATSDAQEKQIRRRARKRLAG